MHNEAENVELFLQLYESICKHFSFEFSIVIVNNASTDDTLRKLNAISRRFPKMDVVDNPYGKGYGDGVQFGLQKCQTQYALIITSDLQYSYSDAITLIELFIQLVCTSPKQFSIQTNRRRRLDGFYSGIRGRCWKRVLNTLFHFPHYFDPASQLKIVPVDTAIRCKSSDFTWDIEQILVARNQNLQMEVVPISFYPRKFGKSSLSQGILSAEFTAFNRLRNFYNEKKLN
jgi:glycosyltransferase involved in cell wall biosynthesis